MSLVYCVKLWKRREGVARITMMKFVYCSTCYYFMVVNTNNVSMSDIELPIDKWRSEGVTRTVMMKFVYFSTCYLLYGIMEKLDQDRPYPNWQASTLVRSYSNSVLRAILNFYVWACDSMNTINMFLRQSMSGPYICIWCSTKVMNNKWGSEWICKWWHLLLSYLLFIL